MQLIVAQNSILAYIKDKVSNTNDTLYIAVNIQNRDKDTINKYSFVLMFLFFSSALPPNTTPEQLYRKVFIFDMYLFKI